jgi:hypothetical protein
MNNTTKIIAATLITIASTVSIADGSRFTGGWVSTDRVAVFTAYGDEIGDNIELGYEDASLAFDLGRETKNMSAYSTIVFQFNLRSTNKSKFNAMYLTSSETSLSNDELCDPDQRPSIHSTRVDNPEDFPYLITYLPYSPHKDIDSGSDNREERDQGWLSVHKISSLPDYLRGQELMLLVCSRDEDGGIDGNLDDFEISDIAVQYTYKDEGDIPLNAGIN